MRGATAFHPGIIRTFCMDNLRRMFDPGTIALIGASDKEGAPGKAILCNLLACRERKVFLVNPARTAIGARPCYGSVAEIPAHIDLAVVATPAPTVPGVVEACGRAGVDGIIIISAGFREVGAEGRKLEEEILRIKRQYPLRILGPNCLGVIRGPMPAFAPPVSGAPPNRGRSPFSPRATPSARSSSTGASAPISVSACWTPLVLPSTLILGI